MTSVQREPQPMTPEEASMCLHDLYGKYRPGYLVRIPSLLKHCRGKEAQLVDRVRAKYEGKLSLTPPKESAFNDERVPDMVSNHFTRRNRAIEVDSLIHESTCAAKFSSFLQACPSFLFGFSLSRDNNV